MIRRPPRSTRTDTLFPYTTLFRSGHRLLAGDRGQFGRRRLHLLRILGGFADAHVDHDLVDPRNLPRILVAELLDQLLANLVLVDVLHTGSAHCSSEERRVGKECVSSCSSGWSQYL